MAKADLIKRIAAVDPVHAETMSENPTEFQLNPLPFYRRFQLLRATVDLPHKPIQVRYVDDGSRIIILQATPDRIYEINRVEDLRLEHGQISSYLHFFFENSSGDPIHMVESEGDVNWLDASSQDPERKALREKAITLIHPAKITPLLGNQDYLVNATAIRGRNLTEISARVRQNGHVDILGERVLVPNAPVPEVGP